MNICSLDIHVNTKRQILHHQEIITIYVSLLKYDTWQSHQLTFSAANNCFQIEQKEVSAEIELSSDFCMPFAYFNAFTMYAINISIQDTLMLIIPNYPLLDFFPNELMGIFLVCYRSTLKDLKPKPESNK